MTPHDRAGRVLLVEDSEGGAQLMRIAFGRRSEAQVAKADWSGVDAAEAQAAITFFPNPTVDIID